jgi:hypothetical protein
MSGARNLGPLEVTEQVLALHRHLGDRKVCPYGRHNVYGEPWTVAGRLFQAREWRRYAGAWDGIPIDRGFVGYPHGHRVVIGRAWVEGILRISKAECIRRARANIYLARRLRRLVR